MLKDDLQFREAPLWPARQAWSMLVVIAPVADSAAAGSIAVDESDHGFPALTLAMEPPEPGLMSRPPRSSIASILSWQLGSALPFRGMLLAAVSLVAFAKTEAYRNSRLVG